MAKISYERRISQSDDKSLSWGIPYLKNRRKTELICSRGLKKSEM